MEQYFLTLGGGNERDREHFRGVSVSKTIGGTRHSGYTDVSSFRALGAILDSRQQKLAVWAG